MSVVHTVTSELYAEKNYISDVKPSLDKYNVVSKFSFNFPPASPIVDDDGDLLIERKQKNNHYDHIIEIEHRANTTLDLVGLQVWRGALLLTDWLIHNSKILSKDKKILELGSGVGLTSIVAAMYSPVICTDIDKGEILELITSNVKKNKKYTKYPVKVLGLNFTSPFSKEIIFELDDVEIILAADVIYDDDVTEAFIETLLKIFAHKHPRTAYIALEKRFVFTVDDLNSVAPCYEHFLKHLVKLQTLNNITIEELTTDFPQYFEYDRVKQLVLWKISSRQI